MDVRTGSYRRARRKFALLVYLITLLWLALTLLQCMIISIFTEIGDIFRNHEWLSVICFIISIIFITIFIFAEQARFIAGLNWILSVVIVELAIIGLFAMAAESKWPDVLMFFLICLILLYLFILIGAAIPHDLTLDVVIIFVASFISLIVSVFLIMTYMVQSSLYAFIMYEVVISIIILFFVMYHAQTISGGRFAEMRVNDYLLATLIFFFDFLIMYMLTFHVQVKYKIAHDAIFPNNTSTTEATDFTTVTAES